MCSESVRQMSILADTKLMRFGKDKRGVSIALETPKTGDEIVYYRGSAILAVPGHIADEVSAMTLDLSEEGLFVLA